MILIADCGSTKIDWCLLEGNSVAKRFETPGMNAVMLTEKEIAERFASEVMPDLPKEGIERIYFYGAGCVSDEVCANVARAINGSLPSADVEVYTDLLGAARAVCGREPGIACIMGTGSNACYYDGMSIADGVSPLGYILGDEGSGAVLGKLLVGNVLKNQLPADLCRKFLDENKLDALTIIDKVYRKPGGNRFLASLSPFLLKNIDRSEIYDMTLAAFSAFFTRNVQQLCVRNGVKRVRLVGSIAHYYADIIKVAALESGIKIDLILKSPMEGLIEFHKGA